MSDELYVVDLQVGNNCKHSDAQVNMRTRVRGKVRMNRIL